MTPIQARRQLIVILLLCVAVIAAVVRHFAEPGSAVHDGASVAMLLWLPAVGSIVAWCFGKLRRARPPAPGPAGFAPDSVFAPQALVEFSLRPAEVPAQDLPLTPGEYRCVLVVGDQGFQIRWLVPAGDSLRRGETRALPVEFLSPRLALQHLPAGTPFRLLLGEAFIGDGRMLEALDGAAAPA